MATITLAQSKTLTPEQQARVLALAKVGNTTQAQQLAYDLYTMNQSSNTKASTQTNTGVASTQQGWSPTPTPTPTASITMNPWQSKLTASDLAIWKQILDSNGGMQQLLINRWLQWGGSDYYTERAQAYLDSLKDTTNTTPTSTSTGGTYTVAGKERTRSQVEDAYAKWTPAQQAEILKQSGMFLVAGKLRTREEVDTAYANGSKDQRAKINQETGLSYDVNTGKPSDYSSEAEKNAYIAPAQTIEDRQKENKLDTTIDYNAIDTAGQQFKTWYDAYIQANKDVYDIATQRQNQQYGYQAQDAQTAIQRNRDDYERFTGQENKDTARQLALNSTDFARSLTNASRAYGQRGILGAWIQKASLGEWVGQFWESQNYFKTLSQRRLDTAGTNMNRANTDYTTNMDRLNTAKANYTSDRAAGVKALDAKLQQEGDTLYNQTQIQNVQLAQQQADQAALDKLYGRTPQNRPISMRIGGKYTY